MSLFLRVVGAGLAAAALSYLLNRVFLSRFGKHAFIYIAPVMEEGLKTIFALGLNVPVVLAHTVFGLIEGTHDLFPFQEKKVAAFLVSLLSHTVFGALTWLIFVYSSSLALSVALVSAFHILWNYSVFKILKSF